MTPLQASPTPRLATAALLALALLQGGCAHVWVDAQGRTHAAGLMWLTLPAAHASQTAAPAGGQALRVRSLGVALTRFDVASSLVLGWQDTTLAFLYDHSLVLADDLRLASPPGGATRGTADDAAATPNRPR
jgi:hypothetical protein